MNVEPAPLLTAMDAHLITQRAAADKAKEVLSRIKSLIGTAVSEERMSTEYIWDGKTSPLVKNTVLSTLLEFGYATKDFPPTQMEHGYTIIDWENPRP